MSGNIFMDACFAVRLIHKVGRTDLDDSCSEYLILLIGTTKKITSQWFLILPWLNHEERWNMFVQLVLLPCRAAHFCNSRNPSLYCPQKRMKYCILGFLYTLKNAFFFWCHLQVRWIMGPVGQLQSNLISPHSMSISWH